MSTGLPIDVKHRRCPIRKLDQPSRHVPGAAFPLSYESQYTPFPDVPGLARAPSCALFICIHVRNNPVRHIDPTGHYIVDTNDGEINPPIPVPEEDDGVDIEEGDFIDITEWVIWQMKWNSQGEDAEVLSEMNSGMGMRASAWFKWRDLVKNGSTWDFKPRFNRARIEYVMIDGKLFRIDIVANIHFGFVGNQVGFTALELHAGAGIAQQTSGDAAKGSLFYFGDEPVDAHAIQFGIQLSNTYGTDFTYDEFIHLFNLYVDAGLFEAYRPVFA